MLFSVVPLLATKTCQNSFSEPEEKRHSTTCIHIARFSSTSPNRVALSSLPIETCLPAVPYYPNSSLVVSEATFTSTGHSPATAHANI